MNKTILIADYFQQKNNNQIFFDKKVTAASQCKVPWVSLIINRFGAAYICVSPAWVPVNIGSILDYDNIFDLLNSPTAQSIRTEILNNRYSYCNNNLCKEFFSLLPNNSYVSASNTNENFKLLTNFHPDSKVTMLPKEIVFDFDYTCNFQCPSCRTEVINYNTGPESEINKKIVEKIKTLIIDNISNPTVLRWAGGEPFISRAYCDIWEYIVEKNNYNINSVIQTNGSYLNKKKDMLVNFIPYVYDIRISFDAGTKQTYEKIRKFGNWETLVENSRLAADIVNEAKPKKLEEYKTQLTSDFVVQLDNFREIPEYIKICKEIGFKMIRLSKMWNWGTWPTEEFNRLNVSDNSHPLYSEFIEIIKPYKNDSTIDLNHWKNDIT